MLAREVAERSRYTQRDVLAPKKSSARCNPGPGKQLKGARIRGTKACRSLPSDIDQCFT